MFYHTRFWIFVLITFLSLNSFAQSKGELQIEQPGSKQELSPNNADSLIALHKVMLIPYDPMFYLSDAEQDIMEQTNRDPQLTRSAFRRNIDFEIQRAIEKSHPCISVLNDEDSLPSLRETLISLYSKTGYRYDKPMPVPVKKEKPDSLKSIKYKVEKDALDSKTAAQYLTVKGDAQYMNAVISKPALLNDLYVQYGTDIFVFVNQFEIKTNYNNCLDIANKIYQRELLLHFSVYDKSGKQLAGTYAMTFFPSDSNLAQDIMKNCFPQLARFVALCIP